MVAIVLRYDVMIRIYDSCPSFLFHPFDHSPDDLRNSMPLLDRPNNVRLHAEPLIPVQILLMRYSKSNIDACLSTYQ